MRVVFFPSENAVDYKEVFEPLGINPKNIKEFDPKAKVVMCSAMGQKPMVKEALEAGAMDFIIKPFDKDKAIKILEMIADKEI